MAAQNPFPVLVVDDDPGIREAVGRLLEKMGHPRAFAQNGREALAHLRGTQAAPGLVLLDLMMPEMNGWQFLEERQKDARLLGIPVAIMSAALEASTELPRVAGYLRKPFSLARLQSLFEHLDSGKTYRDELLPLTQPRRDRLRVLLIEEDDAEARLTQAHLAHSQEFTFEISRQSHVDALSKIVPGDFDLILLDLNLAGESGLSSVEKTRQHAPGVALVVLTTDKTKHLREEAFRRGADDSIEKRLQTPELLGRTLYYSFDRQRLRAELERERELAAQQRESRGLARWTQTRSAVAAEMLGHAPLRKASPAVFQGFVEEYTAICERSVVAKGYDLDVPQQRKELQKLADAVALLRVGPADIVDIYQGVLARLGVSPTPELTAAKREEARMMLVGLLGFVLAIYRMYVGPERPGGSTF